MDIESASKELYLQLRKYDEVVGIGVSQSNGIEYIVVYLAKITKLILKKIPQSYKGNFVKTEVTGNFLLQ